MHWRTGNKMSNPRVVELNKNDRVLLSRTPRISHKTIDTKVNGYGMTDKEASEYLKMLSNYEYCDYYGY